jgi:uncharacterized membrane protein YgaE (UPF0421/DUF939 family)
MSARIKLIILYIAKVITGVLIVFFIASLIDYKNVSWSLFSVILVLSPEGKDAVRIALDRIKANVIGASIGFFCLFIGPSDMWTISIALAVTIVVCFLLKLDDSARTAMAATVIIMLHQQGAHLWSTAIERVIAVMAGCALGLLITYFFHAIFYAANGKILPTQHHPEHS